MDFQEEDFQVFQHEKTSLPKAVSWISSTVWWIVCWSFMVFALTLLAHGFSALWTKVFGKKQRGIGYGGDKSDAVELRSGQEKAARNATSKDQTDLDLLIQMGDALRHATLSSELDLPKLVTTLRRIFESQVPGDWGKRKKLLVVAVVSISLLIRNYAEDLDSEEARSLFKAFETMAKSAAFIATHQGSSHRLLAEKMLNVQVLLGERMNGVPCSGVAQDTANATQLYKEALGPLRFEFCERMSPGHLFMNRMQSRKLDTKALFHQLSSYSHALPVELGSSIFVRVLEDRLDVIRVLILGPEGTPYGNGCFFFDVWLEDYPNKPPNVKLLTTGNGTFRMNPNLYADGKVCLSLLGTWFGPGWQAGISTLLQVLVSIQSLIFVKEPYFNEPAYGKLQTLGIGYQKSMEYNSQIRRGVLQHAILPYVRSRGDRRYPEFEPVLKAHFRIKKDSIRQQVLQWREEDPSTKHVVKEIVAALNQLTPYHAEGHSMRSMNKGEVPNAPPEVTERRWVLVPKLKPELRHRSRK